MSTEAFPVVWDDPKDAELSWSCDRAHAPEPVRPLGQVWASLVAPGFTHAFGHYAVPVKNFRMIVVNGYFYTSVELVDASQEELERMAGEAQAKIAGAMGGIADSWDATFLPEIKELLGSLETFDLAGASLNDLVTHWDRMIDIQKRLYEIHFLVLTPVMFALSEFDELYRGMVKTDDAYAAYRLLQGFDNLTVASGRALWELSRKALAAPDVRRTIEVHDARDVMGALERTEEGRAFAIQLRSYLDYYGQRGDKWDVSYPSWIEDPTPVIGNLERYIAQDTHPAADVEHAAAERERAVAEARERLKDDAMLPMFEFLLKAAQEGIVLSEDHGFWIDFRGGYRFRRVCMEFGRRFTDAGTLESADDVFYLHADELLECARDPRDMRALVAERKAERDRWAGVTPPQQIGAPEQPIPMADNPIARAFAKFGGAEPASPASDREVCGNAGSPGVVRGTARIIRTIADGNALEPGDVLVAETTSPPWTPLFAIASAVVTDTGGILGHCAVVAREYQIPAVVGCRDATSKIRDGQTIEVDGTEGIVRILG